MAGATVNGNYYSFADIEAQALGLAFVGFTSVSYSDTVAIEYMRGAARNPIGTTMGELTPKGGITFHRPAWNTLLATLQALGTPGGWRRTMMDLTVSYSSAAGLPTITDVIPGCQIGEVDSDQSSGSGGLMVKLALFPSGQILWNGLPSIVETQIAFAAG